VQTIDPGRIDRREVEVNAVAGFVPRIVRLVGFVRRQTIQDKVHLLLPGAASDHLFEEANELRTDMPLGGPFPRSHPAPRSPTVYRCFIYSKLCRPAEVNSIRERFKTFLCFGSHSCSGFYFIILCSYLLDLCFVLPRGGRDGPIMGCRTRRRRQDEKRPVHRSSGCILE
jgi:hypothetical protein